MINGYNKALKMSSSSSIATIKVFYLPVSINRSPCNIKITWQIDQRNCIMKSLEWKIMKLNGSESPVAAMQSTTMSPTSESTSISICKSSGSFSLDPLHEMAPFIN
jgi:hypothetical protein